MLAALAVFALGVQTAGRVQIRVLKTEDFTITIRDFCPGERECKHVEYSAVSLAGRTLLLSGTRSWIGCAKLAVPCADYEYQFQRASYTYFIRGTGERTATLTVVQYHHLAVDQDGTWVSDKTLPAQ